MLTNIFGKNCKNCRFFIRHYIKTETGFKAEACGCCSNSNQNIYRKRRTIMQIYTPCDSWEPMEKQIEERKISISCSLNKMRQSLEEIAFILKDDMEN